MRTQYCLNFALEVPLGKSGKYVVNYYNATIKYQLVAQPCPPHNCLL
jgi:hypothetical protein